MKEKREHQQEKLLLAACELVAENGIAALRTRDIASKTGVCVGTLHYCFATKDELLKALYLLIRAEFRQAAEEVNIAGGAVLESIEGQSIGRIHLLRSQSVVFRAWRAFIREAWTNPLICQIVKEHYDEQRVRIARMLTIARANGSLPPSSPVSDKVTAAMIVSLYEGLTIQWTLDPDSVNPEEYAQGMHRLLGFAIGDEQMTDKE